MTVIGSNQLINSLYVGLHVQSTGSPYGSAQNIINAMNYLGIHNFRDSPATAGMTQAAATQTALAEYGFGGMYILGGNFGPSYLTEQLQALGRIGYSARFVEGPNEPNYYDHVVDSNGNVTYYEYKGQYGSEGVLAQHRDIYNWVHSNLYGVGVVAPSSPGWFEYHPSTWNIAEADFGNAHAYGPVRNGGQYADVTFTIHSNVTYAVPYATSAGGKWVMSEGGGNTQQGNPAYTTEEVQAKSILKTIIGGFGAGASAVSIHDLYDAGPGEDPGWGLFHNDGSAKWSAWAVQHLTNFLKDTSPVAASVQGTDFGYWVDNAPNQYTLGIQFANKEVVAVWGDTADQRTVTVHFDKMVGWINVHDTLGGGSAYLGFGSSASFTTIYDRPFLFELVLPMEQYKTVQAFYDTAFNVVGDGDGVTWHVNHLVANGWSNAQVAQDFVNVMPAMDDWDFVRTLYRNGLEREGSEAEVNWWVNHLHTDMSRADVLNYIATSPESFNGMQTFRASAEYQTLIG